MQFSTTRSVFTPFALSRGLDGRWYASEAGAAGDIFCYVDDLEAAQKEAAWINDMEAVECQEDRESRSPYTGIVWFVEGCQIFDSRVCLSCAGECVAVGERRSRFPALADESETLYRCGGCSGEFVGVGF